MSQLAGFVLAAGAGTRLRPLTAVLPKALCPVGGRPLVDLAIERVQAVTPDVAANVHHGRAMLEQHLQGRVHVSVEPDVALGTAGALGRARDWIAGRAVMVVNADAWTTANLAPLLDRWDGERLRVLVAGNRAEVSARMRVAGALLPWSAILPLRGEPSGLWETTWRDADVEAVAAGPRVPFVDCGTPAAYLAANLAASGGAPVVGDGAVVEGELVRSVVWSNGSVARGERLVDSIRFGDRLTVAVRP